MSIPITAGAGTNVDTELVGSDHVQRIKPAWGPALSATDTDHAVGKGLPVQFAPVSHYHLITAATTNANNIKGSAGKLRSVHSFNDGVTGAFFIKFHDVSGTPTPGTGVVFTVAVQAGTPRDVVLPGARSFTNGIGITVVRNQVDSDATAVLVNEGSIEVTYE